MSETRLPERAPSSAGAHIPRSQWMRCWLAVAPQVVQSLAQTLAQRYSVEDLSQATSGLGLLTLRDSALGQPYNLGEIPLAHAHVRLHSADRHMCEGAACVLDDRSALAQALAILDAITAAGWPGHEDAQALLAEGAHSLEETARQRRALLLATRVDFALLSTSDDDEAEEIGAPHD
jgi:alpha-D-ribose 1-methylphosphonate 5-triphosphate synthase subunit PhnG